MRCLVAQGPYIRDDIVFGHLNQASDDRLEYQVFVWVGLSLY